MESQRLLRLAQVRAKTGLCKSQIYAHMKEKQFPSSIKIGPTAVAWLEQEIDEWISLKIAESRNITTN